MMHIPFEFKRLYELLIYHLCKQQMVNKQEVPSINSSTYSYIFYRFILFLRVKRICLITRIF